MSIVIAMLLDKMEQLKLNHTATLATLAMLVTLLTLLTLISFIDECKCKCKLVDGATKEQMRLSVTDFFEQLLIPKIQSRDNQPIPPSLKVSGFPKGMHVEKVEFRYQASVKRIRVKVESMVNSGYPFVYIFRTGGRNGHKQETYHA
jgi:hypothetical protein